ncbi:MAG: hypothetical protein ACOCSM_03610, partial [Bacillota bacterium]
MKKTMLMIAAVLLVFSLAACSRGQDEPLQRNTPTQEDDDSTLNRKDRALNAIERFKATMDGLGAPSEDTLHRPFSFLNNDSDNVHSRDELVPSNLNL